MCKDGCVHEHANTPHMCKEIQRKEQCLWSVQNQNEQSANQEQAAHQSNLQVILCKEHCNDHLNREHANTPTSAPTLPKHNLQMHPLKN